MNNDSHEEKAPEKKIIDIYNEKKGMHATLKFGSHIRNIDIPETITKKKKKRSTAKAVCKQLPAFI